MVGMLALIAVGSARKGLHVWHRSRQVVAVTREAVDPNFELTPAHLEPPEGYHRWRRNLRTVLGGGAVVLLGLYLFGLLFTDRGEEDDPQQYAGPPGGACPRPGAVTPADDGATRLVVTLVAPPGPGQRAALDAVAARLGAETDPLDSGDRIVFTIPAVAAEGAWAEAAADLCAIGGVVHVEARPVERPLR
jgi:hypothetical protein